jgi:hypothetical protein
MPDARTDAIPLARMLDTFMHRSHDWIDADGAVLEAHADPLVREAFTIASRDAVFIGVKLRRALDGRDRPIHGEEGDEDDPVQNDWNGSAKVALISIERSIDAWDEVPSSGLRRSV